MDKKKAFLIPWAWGIIGVILMAAGIYVYMNREPDIIKIARILGVAMLIAGIINFAICYVFRHRIHGVRWLEADGLATILLSLFPLFNEMVFTEVIPFFFGVWELFSGIIKLMDTAELRHDGIKCWKSIAVISLIELVSGTISLIEPVEIAVGFHHMLGFIFMIQALGFARKVALYEELIS